MPYHQLAQQQVYYELTGQGSKTLVLFNGITMSTMAWAFMLPTLEQHYQLLRLDFLGQGASSKPVQAYYALAEQAELAHALLEILGIDKIYLTGLSYGGMVAQHFARRYPHDIEKLVLASTLAWSDSVNVAISDSWIAAQQAGGLDLRYTISMPWLFSSHFLATYRDLLPEFKQLASLVDWECVIRLINGIKQHDARSWLDTITTPTLVLLGTEDRLTPLYQSQLLVEQMPHATLKLIPKAGHVLHLEAVDAFCRAIIHFCH